jgi:Tfp pilus assembly protein PilW
MKRPGTPIGPSSGISLIELMVTVVILGIIVLAVTGVLLTSGRAESRTMRRAEIQSSSRQALSLMATELRQAGADPASPPLGMAGIVTADVNLIRVRADLNGDRAIQTTEPSEDVTYSYNSGTRVLTRDPGAGAAPLLSNVTAMQLSYFDSANQLISPLPLSATNAARVNSIGLTVTSENRDSRAITLTTRINLRNR